MIPWKPENPTPCRTVDRPAVAILLTVALFLGALLGLYAAHVFAHRDEPGKVSSARYVPGIEPLCRTYTRGHAGTVRRPVPSITPCHRTYVRGIA